MEVSIQDEVEPEGPLVIGHQDAQEQGATVVPIGVKEEGVAGSFSDADDLLSNPTSDDITPTGEPKKRKGKRNRKSTVSSASGSDEGSSTSSSGGSAKASTKRSGKKVRRRKRGLGDAQSSSAPAGLLVDNKNDDHHGGDVTTAGRGASTLKQGGSAPVPAVHEVEDDNHSSSSSSSSGGGQPPLGRRNSAPEVAKQETKRVSIPLLGRRLRLDIKFGHEIVHKEPKVDVEHQDGKGEEKNISAPAPAVEKESQVEAKRHDTNEEGHHHQPHHHHNPFHFLSNLFHHHHHQPKQGAAAQKGSTSPEHPVVPQNTDNVAPKVEVMA